jgi:hypothetical protein
MHGLRSCLASLLVAAPLAAQARLAAALAARDRATAREAWRELTDSLAPADRRYLGFQL